MLQTPPTPPGEPSKRSICATLSWRSSGDGGHLKKDIYSIRKGIILIWNDIHPVTCMVKTLPTFHLKLSKGVIIGGNAFEKARIHKYTVIVY